MTTPEFTLLDGGMGRELQRRGLIEPATIWSGSALIDHPETVRDIHVAFIAAGADVITTSNYGIVPSLLAMEGMADRLDELTDTAVTLAREARKKAGVPVRIAGSLPPLDTSYRPDKVGAPDEIAEVYGHIAGRLARGVDLLICETMSSADEALGAARGAATTGLPIWVAWSLDDAANGRLRSGETVTDALAALDGVAVEAYLFNCCMPEAVTRALPELRAATSARVGAYANAFVPLPADYVMGAEGGHPIRGDMSPATYTDLARGWRAAGADIIGGCCGIGPDYIAALRAALH